MISGGKGGSPPKADGGGENVERTRNKGESLGDWSQERESPIFRSKARIIADGLPGRNNGARR